jgi:hypothetical protein
MVFGVGTVRCSFLRVMGTIYVSIISSKNPRKTNLNTPEKKCFVIFYTVIREKNNSHCTLPKE